MRFLRPEVRAFLWRWRECVAGLLLLVCGLWLALDIGYLLAIFGYALAVLGLALLWLGRQRARFRMPGGGVGAVQVDEGRVTYFGPLNGGSVSMQVVQRLVLNGQMYPPHWQLEQSGAPPLMIPMNAAGSEALFDAFATLPGLETERMLDLLQQTPRQAIVIWEGDPGAVHSALVH
ncbi:MAG: hypothetical protein AAF755_05120 [Pseudomonadota bacterium]